MIDVFFAGLMVICLQGHAECPQAPERYGNTAWVVQAEEGGRPCGWYSKETTKLVLEVDLGRFKYTGTLPSVCDPDEEKKLLSCDLSGLADICIEVGRKQDQKIEASSRWLLRIDEIDDRFLSLSKTSLESRDWVPTRISFPAGDVGSGPIWPTLQDSYPDLKADERAQVGQLLGLSDLSPSLGHRLWFRSNWYLDGALPRVLSDRLKMTYGTDSIDISSCDSDRFVLKLKLLGTERGGIIFKNKSEKPYPDEYPLYDNLPYLLWYYRLGKWSTRDCPAYDNREDSAVVLRCVRTNPGVPCSRAFQADTVFWPSVLGP